MCYRIKSERGIGIKVNVHTNTAHKTRPASHQQGHTHKPHLQDSTGKSLAGTHTQTPPTRQQVASRDTHTNPTCTYKTRLASRQQGHTHKPHLQDSTSKSPAGTHTHNPTYKTRPASRQQGHTHKPHLQDSTSKSPAGTHTHTPPTRLD